MRAKFLALSVALCTGLCPHLQGQSVDTSTHQQTVPTGWSAFNSNLEMADSSVSALVPAPPEGTLLFKLTSDDEWDVNQFQWGRWNFADQTIEPGDSGIIFNPGDPILISWEGTPQSIESFSGYLSGATPISVQAYDTELNPIGSIMIEFNAVANPRSNQFWDQYGNLQVHTWVGIWAPEFPEISDRDTQRIFYFEPPNGGQPKSKTVRNTGRDFYINNYVPAFDIDWRLGPRGRSTSMCARVDAPLSPGDYPSSIQVMLLDSNIPDHSIAEIPLQDDLNQLGYLDVAGGSTFSFPIGFEFGSLSLTHTSAETEPLIVSRKLGWAPPAPPEVISGLAASGSEFTHPNIPHPEHIGAPCPMEIEFDRMPPDLRIVEGANVVIPTGVCDLSASHPSVKEVFDQYITFSLYRSNPDGLPELVADSLDHQSFVLSGLSAADSGEYYYSYSDSTTHEDCFLWDSSLINSEPFEIIVVPEENLSTEEPILSHQQTIPHGWSAINNTLNTEDNRITALIPNPPEGFLFFKWVGNWDVYQFQFGQWDSEPTLMPGESGLVLNPGEPFDIQWQGEVVEAGPYSGFFSAATAISEEAMENVGAGTTVFEYLPALEAESPLFESQWPDEKSMTFEDSWAPETPVLTTDDSPGIFFVANPESPPHLPVFGRHVGRDVYVNNYVPALGVNAPIGHGACEFIGGDFESMQATGEVPGIHAMEVEIVSENISVSFPVFRSGTAAGYFDVRQGATLSLGSSDLLRIPAFFSAADGLTISRLGTGSAPRPPTVLSGLQPEFILKPNPGPHCGIGITFSQGPKIVTGARGEPLTLPINLCNFQQPAAALYWNYYQINVPRILEWQSPSGDWLELARTRDSLEFQFDELQPLDQGTYRIRAFDELISPTCGITVEEAQIISESFQVVVDNHPPVADGGSDLFLVDLDGDGFARTVLDASSSSDPDSEITGWRWQWADEDYSGAVLESRFPLGQTKVQLTVRDDSGAEHTDEVLVYVYSFSTLETPPLNLIGFRDRAGEVLAMELAGLGAGGLWGTDSYSDHSTLGTAAVHAGILAEGESGTVYVLIGEGAEAYQGTTQNEITSDNLGPWGGSFRFVQPEILPKPDPATLTRSLPAAPPRIDELFTVSIEVTPNQPTEPYWIEDSLDLDFEIAEISHGGEFEASESTVRWGPFESSDPFTLTYQIKISNPIFRGGATIFFGNGESGENEWSTLGDVVLVISDDPPVEPPSLQRDIVPTAQADETIQVQLSVEPQPNLRVSRFTEQLPKAVNLEEVFQGGTFDPETRILTWNLAEDASSQVGYRIRIAPIIDIQQVTFVGEAELVLAEGTSPDTLTKTSELTLLPRINPTTAIVRVTPLQSFYAPWSLDENSAIRPADEAFVGQLFVQQIDGSYAPVGEFATAHRGVLQFAPTAIDLTTAASPLTGKLVGWLVQFGESPDQAWTGVVESEPQELPHLLIGQEQPNQIPATIFAPLTLELPFCLNGETFLINSASSDNITSSREDWFREGQMTGTTLAIAGQDATLTIPIYDGCAHGGLFRWTRGGETLGLTGVAGEVNPGFEQVLNRAEWNLRAVQANDAGIYDVEHLAYGGRDQARLVVLESEPTRTLAQSSKTNTPVEVSIMVPPFRGIEQITVTEKLPEGATIIHRGDGSLSEDTGTLIWHLDSLPEPQSLNYEIMLTGAARQVTFEGSVRANDLEGLAIAGANRLTVTEAPSLEAPEPCAGDGGLISFLNPRSPVLDLDGEPASDEVMGQLFVGLTEDNLDPVCNPIPVLASGVFNGGEQPVAGTIGGEVVFVQLRAWRGANNFESALVRGISEIQNVTLKKPGDLVPAPILGTASFQLAVVPQEVVFQPLVREDNTITLSWSGRGKLQEAPSVDGPYTDATNQSNPQVIEINDLKNHFFRIVGD